MTFIKEHKAIFIVAACVCVMAAGAVAIYCGANNAEEQQLAPVGNYTVGEQRDVTATTLAASQVEYITFSGYGSFTVSKDKPEVELSNPANNLVNFVFTLIDPATDEVIARTGEVAPGDYVYVNVVDYYKNPGTYDMSVQISTFAADGKQLNGMKEKWTIVVK